MHKPISSSWIFVTSTMNVSIASCRVTFATYRVLFIIGGIFQPNPQVIFSRCGSVHGLYLRCTWAKPRSRSRNDHIQCLRMDLCPIILPCPYFKLLDIDDNWASSLATRTCPKELVTQLGWGSSTIDRRVIDAIFFMHATLREVI